MSACQLEKEMQIAKNKEDVQTSIILCHYWFQPIYARKGGQKVGEEKNLAPISILLASAVPSFCAVAFESKSFQPPPLVWRPMEASCLAFRSFLGVIQSPSHCQGPKFIHVAEWTTLVPGASRVRGNLTTSKFSSIYSNFTSFHPLHLLSSQV